MTENDFDRTARLWLEDGPTALSDRVLQAALDEIHVTRQRRAWWPAKSYPTMTKFIGLAAATAVVALFAAVGIGLLDGGSVGRPGDPQVSPTPVPTPLGTIMEGNPVLLEPGTYVTADPFLVRVTLTVPGGWNGKLGGPYALYLARQNGGGEVIVSVFDNVSADPCDQNQGLLNPPPGPTVDDLATALTTRPGLVATTPTDVTFGGYAGKQFTITAPADFTGCALGPEGYTVWQLPLGAVYTMTVGQRDRIWILDVDGQRIVIDAQEPAGQPEQINAEIQGIVDSIRLAPLN